MAPPDFGFLSVVIAAAGPACRNLPPLAASGDQHNALSLAYAGTHIFSRAGCVTGRRLL
jgi:hypothetical protein